VVNNKGGINPIDDAPILSMLDRLDELYRGFPWESRIWREQGVRRSPYRTLILFGLSARTKDRLLVRMCHDFFRRFPTSERLLQGWADGDLDRIVRVGQKPFIESAAQVIRDHEGVVPRDRDGLKQIKGVGEKIAGCVIAYGWGGEALPLDGNACRLVERVSGIAAGVPVQLLRASLKSLYLSHRPAWTNEVWPWSTYTRLSGSTPKQSAPKPLLASVVQLLSVSPGKQNTKQILFRR
jgi:endonuclease III